MIIEPRNCSSDVHYNMQSNKEMDLFLESLLADVDLARRMIEKGIDINMSYNGDTPLQFAVTQNNLPAVQLLLEHRADVTQASLFHPILRSRETEIGYNILKLLLEHGADCNGVDGNGRPLFFLALNETSLQCAKSLLDHGADITAVDREGKTALHYAVEKIDVLQFLLDQGLDIESIDNRGQSVLHHAVFHRNFETCEFLLKNRANVNKTDMENVTPLFVAVAYYNIPETIVQVLLEYGADVTHKARGRSILETAVRLWFSRDVAHLLIREIAKLHLNINECDRQILDNGDCKEYYEKCLLELREMKLSRFYNSLSIFDILTESERVISGYAKNEELIAALDGADYDERFPLYFGCLKKKFDIEVEKQRSRQSAAISLSNIFKFNDPSHIVNQKILGYLRHQDLKSLGT